MCWFCCLLVCISLLSGVVSWWFVSCSHVLRVVCLVVLAFTGVCCFIRGLDIEACFLPAFTFV